MTVTWLKLTAWVIALSLVLWYVTRVPVAPEQTDPYATGIGLPPQAGTTK